ncbi:hypothetical protein RSAG8_02369, partial [Rhizoctonia solani AG-8 WAC10335]
MVDVRHFFAYFLSIGLVRYRILILHSSQARSDLRVSKAHIQLVNDPLTQRVRSERQGSDCQIWSG